MGTANLLDNATVQHVSGGVSTVSFKSYAQGSDKWQGPTLEALWLDEEPPQDIYTEGLDAHECAAPCGGSPGHSPRSWGSARS